MQIVQSWLSRPGRRLGTFFTDEIRDVLVNRILLVTVSDSQKLVEDPWNVFGIGFKDYQRTLAMGAQAAREFGVLQPLGDFEYLASCHLLASASGQDLEWRQQRWKSLAARSAPR